jgi:tetratricopeptide (TPR) repeat protein
LRIALADALMAGRRYQEAVEVLSIGVDLAPGNAQFKEQLKLAESFVKEQKWIQRQSGQYEETSQSNAQFRRNVIRCTRLKGESALSACEQALGEKPEDTRLLAARGDALFDVGRYGEAVFSYRQALNLEPGDASVTEQLSRAEAQRRKAVGDCRALERSDGLEACSVALLEGAGDEFTVRVRQGELLLDEGREDEALQAYRAAQKLEPRNAQVQQAIETLTTPVASAKPAKPRSKAHRPAVEAKVEPMIEDKPEQVVPPPPPPLVEIPTPDSGTGSAPASTSVETQASPEIVESHPSPEPESVEIAAAPTTADTLPVTESDRATEQGPALTEIRTHTPRYSNAPVAPGITY